MRWRGEVPITISVFAALLAVAVLLAAGLILYGHRQNATAALVVAQQLEAEVAQTVLERVLALTRPLASIADMAPSWNGIGAKADLDGHPSQALMLRLLERFPQLTSIYLGYGDGDFYQVYGLDDAVRAAIQAPAEARFTTRLIFRPVGGRRLEAWKHLDAARKVVGNRVERDPEFDPRQRPWYQLAVAEGGLARTDPYAFASTRRVGMTVAHPFAGDVPGVLGVDMTLAGLSDFLAEEPLAAEGLIMMFRADGTVIAHARAEELVADLDDDAGGVRLAKVGDLGDPLAVALHTIHQEHGGELPEVIEVDGRTYVGRVEVLPVETGAEELLGILLPVETFTGPIDAIGRKSALMSVGFLLLLTPLIWLIARRISKPLQQLAGEAEAIRAFELEAPIELPSHIREVRQLAGAMDRMKAGLRTFGLYVPKALVRQMMQADSEPSLGGERQEVTVLFTDVANFTDFAETVPPEALMQRMSAYFEEMTQVLMANGATIDKYIGDAIMAFWNAPLRDPDHAALACHAALAARLANRALNQRWAAQGQPVMVTRFGLHLGEAVIGNVGSSDRMNYTAIGASVNLAARLEGLNKHYGTEVLITEALAARVRDRFLTRMVDRVVPKGIAEPVLIHELVAALEGPEEGLATAAERARCDRWQAAYEAHLERAFAPALAGFRALAAERPDDPLAALYVRRVEGYLAAPPGPDWTGVEVYHNK